jgi:mRNA interferase MazF
VRGEVVVLRFPFSDLRTAKLRPALVLASLDGDDILCAMITSRAVRDRYAVPLDQRDFSTGGLPRAGNVRPSRLFTADSSIVRRSAGQLSQPALAKVVEAVVALLDPVA